METEGVPNEDATAETLRVRALDIETQLVEIEKAAKTAAGGIGFGKRIGEGTNIAVERISEVSMHSSLQVELAKIRRAQEKMHEGNDGRCDECGEVIAEERREALPWAVLCVSCAV